MSNTAYKGPRKEDDTTDPPKFFSPATIQQLPPKEGEGDVWLMVMRDMEERRQLGVRKYGRPVHPDNGRDHLIDLYQELLDACVYIRAEIELRAMEGKST